MSAALSDGVKRPYFTHALVEKQTRDLKLLLGLFRARHHERCRIVRPVMASMRSTLRAETQGSFPRADAAPDERADPRRPKTPGGSAMCTSIGPSHQFGSNALQATGSDVCVAHLSTSSVCTINSRRHWLCGQNGFASQPPRVRPSARQHQAAGRSQILIDRSCRTVSVRRQARRSTSMHRMHVWPRAATATRVCPDAGQGLLY